MRWLEWLPHDPHKLIGGIETHVLSMAHGLRARGVSVEFSSDPEVLFHGQGYDVIRTHGDLLPKGYLWKVKRGPLRVHTLHGSALGQMHALNESHRARHWKALYREWVACHRANLIAGVHENLELMRFYSRFSGKTCVIRNGWDALSAEASPQELQLDLGALAQSWAFIGRGWDVVKGGDRVIQALQSSRELNIVAVPGEGLPDHPQVFKTGRLSASGVRQVLKHSQGLILPSRFEGFALVLLEALASGVPVVASRVGGNPFVEQCQPRGLQWFTHPDDPALFLQDLQRAQAENPSEERESRAEWNQAHLWNWQQCTDLLLERVQAMLNQRRP